MTASEARTSMTAPRATSAVAHPRLRGTAFALAATFLTLLAACSGGGLSGTTIGKTAQNDPVAPDFPVAYIKRTLPATPKSPTTPMTTLTDDLRVQRTWNGPADVFVRLSASPSAKETNITGALTQGLWDARDLDVSYDGTKLLFSLRQPLIPNAMENQQPLWALYEYDTTTSKLRRVIPSDIIAAEGHDVGGHYLPDGRILFSSSRQRGEKAILIDEGKSQFSAGVEGGPGFGADRNLPAFTLHVMNADGSNIHQIDYNQSHDLDPSVMENGQIVYSRWDTINGSGMQLYTANPDGSQQQLLYGRNSHYTGLPTTTPIQFVQPRARTDGKIVTIIRPFPSGTAPAGVTAYAGITPDGNTEFGGDLALIDQANYVEYFQGTGLDPTATGPGQARLVVNNVITAPGVSPGGRFASAYPLLDGTNRMLVSWTQCRVVVNTLYQPCASATLNGAAVTTAPPLYGIWIYDASQSTQQPIVAPTEGIMYTDIVAMQPRTLPNPIVYDRVAGVDYDQSLSNAVAGIIDIKSVYDFDGAAQLSPAGGAVSITTLRDPAQTTAAQRPARFLRIEKAVGLPDKKVLKALPGSAFGAASQMRQILGYVPVQPDGSVMAEVPANVAFQISVLDANGQRIGGTHDSWLQVLPGEVKVCNGCHIQGRDAPGATNKAHGRAGLYPSLNPGAPTAGQPFPNTDPTLLAPGQAKAGETMAEALARVYCASASIKGALADCPASPTAKFAMQPSVDIIYTDVWTSPAVRAPDPSFALQYSTLGLLNLLAPLSPTSVNCELSWNAQCRIIPHYPQHIAQLWTLPRQVLDAGGNVTADHTCVTCHSPKNAQGVAQIPAASLDLTSTASSVQPDWYTSFQELLFPRPPCVLNMAILSCSTTVSVTNPTTGVTTTTTVPALPAPMVGGSARASSTFFALFSNAADANHYQVLSPAELRVVSEWLDIGAQYYNNPFVIPVAN